MSCTCGCLAVLVKGVRGTGTHPVSTTTYQSMLNSLTLARRVTLTNINKPHNWNMKEKGRVSNTGLMRKATLMNGSQDQDWTVLYFGSDDFSDGPLSCLHDYFIGTSWKQDNSKQKG